MPLQQRCYRFNATAVDVQSWRRHMRQHHSKFWAQQESRIASRLQQITFGRPCPFCKTEYQKTPAVHATKCLPLLQLVVCAGAGIHDIADEADLGTLGIHFSSQPAEAQEGSHERQRKAGQASADKGGRSTGPLTAEAETDARGSRREWATQVPPQDAGAASSKARVFHSDAASAFISRRRTPCRCTKPP